MWRIGIALHSAPRFAVSFLHYNYYIQRLGFVKESQRGFFKKLISLNFWLNTIENASLVGVTYVTNRENYRKFVVDDFSLLWMTLLWMTFVCCGWLCLV